MDQTWAQCHNNNVQITFMLMSSLLIKYFNLFQMTETRKSTEVTTWFIAWTKTGEKKSYKIQHSSVCLQHWERCIALLQPVDRVFDPRWKPDPVESWRGADRLLILFVKSGILKYWPMTEALESEKAGNPVIASQESHLKP